MQRKGIALITNAQPIHAKIIKCKRAAYLFANAELLQVLVMRNVGVDCGADDLLGLLAVLLPPLLVLRLDVCLFLLQMSGMH